MSTTAGNQNHITWSCDKKLSLQVWKTPKLWNGCTLLSYHETKHLDLKSNTVKKTFLFCFRATPGGTQGLFLAIPGSSLKKSLLIGSGNYMRYCPSAITLVPWKRHFWCRPLQTDDNCHLFYYQCILFSGVGGRFLSSVQELVALPGNTWSAYVCSVTWAMPCVGDATLAQHCKSCEGHPGWSFQGQEWWGWDSGLVPTKHAFQSTNPLSVLKETKSIVYWESENKKQSRSGDFNTNQRFISRHIVILSNTSNLLEIQSSKEYSSKHSFVYKLPIFGGFQFCSWNTRLEAIIRCCSTFRGKWIWLKHQLRKH